MICAPGFEIPEGLPRVTITQAGMSFSGQYYHDGYCANVTINQEIINSRKLMLATIAHEACHHILDLSSLNKRETGENERKTDLAMYICGYGELALLGVRNIKGE